MKKSSSTFSGGDLEKERFGVAREEDSPLPFAEVSLSLHHCSFLRCRLLSQLLLGTTPQNVFVFSPWHNHFGLFPVLLGFGRILL